MTGRGQLYDLSTPDIKGDAGRAWEMEIPRGYRETSETMSTVGVWLLEKFPSEESTPNFFAAHLMHHRDMSEGWIRRPGATHTLNVLSIVPMFAPGVHPSDIYSIHETEKPPKVQEPFFARDDETGLDIARIAVQGFTEHDLTVPGESHEWSKFLRAVEDSRS